MPGTGSQLRCKGYSSSRGELGLDREERWQMGAAKLGKEQNC